MSAFGANKAGSHADPESRLAEASETLPKLPRYTVHQKLAVGGMATVYLAQKEGSSDICVIKQLHAHLAEESVVASRFMREAQVSFHLNHTNIATILDSKREAGLLYLAIEYIPGQDVESMMFKLMEQRKMLPPELSITVTLDVLAGLDYAHALTGPDKKPLEIVHRDLSPRNVMVSYDGHVKIIDFGLARTNLGDFRTAPGMVLGTLRYMSPEQAVAEPVDRRSDIYSWSVVLYEMLSGRPLVMGANSQEVLRAVVSQVPPPLSKLNPNLPKALDRVLERGLAKDRRDRFRTSGEMREALLEAAGPLAALDAERHALIGRFVRELFPEAAAESEGFLSAARTEGGGFEPTRVLPTPHDMTQAEYLTRLQTVARVVGKSGSPPPEVMELTRAVTRARVTASRPQVPTSPTALRARRTLRNAVGAMVAAFVALGVLLFVASMDREPAQPAVVLPAVSPARPTAQPAVLPIEPAPGASPREGSSAGPEASAERAAPSTPARARAQAGGGRQRGERSGPKRPVEAPPPEDEVVREPSGVAKIERLLDEADREIERSNVEPAQLERARKLIAEAQAKSPKLGVQVCLGSYDRGGSLKDRVMTLRDCAKKTEVESAK